jgi:hypothetical protein
MVYKYKWNETRTELHTTENTNKEGEIFPNTATQSASESLFPLSP